MLKVVKAILNQDLDKLSQVSTVGLVLFYSVRSPSGPNHVTFFSCLDVVVAELAEWLLPMPEVHSFNPVLWDIL